MGMGHAHWCGGAHGASAAFRGRHALVGALVGALAASTGLCCGAVALGAPASSPRTHGGAAAPPPPSRTLPPPAIANPSWSGELAWASKNGASGFSRVTGTWVQPAVAPSTASEYADTWVGIDGYDGTLLQTGTTAWSGNGGVGYEAWFVAWNGSSSGMTVLDEPLSPGDRMHVAIQRVTTGRWSVALIDQSAGWTWSTTVTYPATGQTAEWIEEAPGTWSTSSRTQTLADYGSVGFTTVGADGTAPASMTAYDVVQNGAVVSYPGTYSPSTASFSLRYGAPVPTVTSVSPPTGPTSGGSTVTLVGQDLATSPVVRFGGVEAQVLSASTQEIVARAPAHAPGNVAVTVAGALANGALANGALAKVPSAVTFDYVDSPGYLVVSSSGRVDAFGAAPVTSAAHGGAPVVGMAKDAATGGYWEATSAGGVYDVGAPDLGTLTALVQREPIGSVAGIASTPTGSGYWLVTTAGDVYDFGAAGAFGTLLGVRLAAPVVGMAATPTGAGYWLVASDGGIFTFGAARFYGSAGGVHLAAPVVGMAATPTGEGYWLVAADGGIFTFGAARFYGSAGGVHLAAPVVGMAATPTGEGYWLVAADGRIFTFGAARFYGSAPAAPKSQQVGILVA